MDLHVFPTLITASHLPPHPIPLGLPSAFIHVVGLDWLCYLFFPKQSPVGHSSWPAASMTDPGTKSQKKLGDPVAASKQQWLGIASAKMTLVPSMMKFLNTDRRHLRTKDNSSFKNIHHLWSGQNGGDLFLLVHSPKYKLHRKKLERQPEETLMGDKKKGNLLGPQTDETAQRQGIFQVLSNRRRWFKLGVSLAPSLAIDGSPSRLMPPLGWKGVSLKSSFWNQSDTLGKGNRTRNPLNNTWPRSSLIC